MKSNAILLVLSLALGLLCSEIAVRFTGVAPTVYRLSPEGEGSAYKLSENPVLGYEYIPSYRHESPNNHNTFAEINSHGFRDTERALAKPEGVQRILLLGDSVVAGHGVEKIEDLLHVHLERSLSDLGSQEDVTYEVLNFGVGGYCTRAEIELLKTRGVSFDPDIVLLLFVGNDYVDQNGEILRHLSSETGNQRDDFFRSAQQELFLRSDLYRLLELRLNLFGLGEEHRDRAAENQAAIGENNVRSGLERFAVLAKEHHFTPLIVLWPEFSDDKIFYLTRDRKPIQEGRLEVEEIAGEFEIPTFRIDQEFSHAYEEKRAQRKSARRASPRWIFTIGDGTHPSPMGTEVGGRILARVLGRYLSENPLKSVKLGNSTDKEDVV